MPQFEYQVMEQGGAKVGHFNERLDQIVAQGFDCIGITGTSPQVSILLRRPARPAQAEAAPAQAQAAQAAPAAPQPQTAAAPRQ
jgi:hypothetical protein